MWRALLKGALLFGAGRLPGGRRLYREWTRNMLGTQATHVDKLSRVWPVYVEVWQSRCGLRLAGRDVWVHEGGWTPFPLFANYLLTGKGGVLTNSEGRVLDRYLARAVNGILTTKLPDELTPRERRRHLESLRWYASAEEAIAAVGGMTYENIKPECLPLESASFDLCHSGGALEHYRPEALKAFLAECHRVLRPGGVASHVFDHRDHLHHADRCYPFLAHFAFSDPLYSLLCGHPLGYHNRLLPEEIMEMFEATGLNLLRFAA